MQQFLLENDTAYRQWRDHKLRGYPEHVEQLSVHISDPYKLAHEEQETLLRICQKTNFAIYSTSHTEKEDKKIVTAIAKQLGLTRMDANLCADQNQVSSIQVMDEGIGSRYIPYTNKPLNWHTDGYYNQDHQRIHAFLMHCVRPAGMGGENTFLDPEILYILLRDNDPKNIEALMTRDAMTIPANQQEPEPVREKKSGPVFLLDKETQSLHMRYTARSRNIVWKDDAATKRARFKLLELLDNNRYLFRHCLQGGEGIVCNNVLHSRTAFTDHSSSRRLLYRARFYDRISKPKGPLHVVAE